MRLSQSVGIWLVALQRLVVADSVHYMNATWPPAHYSWIVTTDGFNNRSDEARFQTESAVGNFCHNRQVPNGVQPVPFPVHRGKLEFNGTEIDSKDWIVNVVFDDVRVSVEDGHFAMAKADNDWIWNASKKDDNLYCSTGLSSIREITVHSNNLTTTMQKAMPETLLDGLEATLGIEMIQRDSTPGSDKNITTVIRQCTFIRFAPRDEVKDLGPCGTGPHNSTTTPTGPPVPETSSEGTPVGNFAIWGTFVIVFGVGAVIGGVAFLYQRLRRRREKNSGEGHVPMYDAAAARRRQQEEFVPAPDYTAANGGVSLPTYDEAVKR